MLSRYAGPLLLTAFVLQGCSTQSNPDSQDQEATGRHAEQAKLGQQLYFDPNLSLNRSQSCATCHDPARGFVDGRDNGVNGAASLGDNGHAVGDRNAPTAAYALFIPAFHKNRQGEYVGGQFHDGRAATLAEQAGGPPLNPGEMAMPDKATVSARLQENLNYVSQFKALFGEQIFASADKTYAAMADSIAAFEKTETFAPFDSKYDRFLKGEYKMTAQEELGRTLFFSQQFTNCNQCHQLKRSPVAAQETFSNYRYHNIGVPSNTALRSVNGAAGTVDHGLLNNPQVSDPRQDGKFKVPTLRNVAVTGPYMHNGVFADLRTVVLFYDKYNSRSQRRTINPESNTPWGQPEVGTTLSLKELESGPALSDQKVDALVAFMRTLTDKRYEHLLQEN